MSGLKYLAASFLSLSLPAASPVQAMEIRQFDKMAVDDKNEYVTELIVGAEKVLRGEGKPDLADRVQKLFMEVRPGDKITAGIAELDINLALARVTDAKNIAKDPHAQRVEVEDAMAVILQKNGIEIPDSFFTILSNFRPKYPPQH